MPTTIDDAAAAVRPAPAVTEGNLFFWEAAREGRLVAQRCGVPTDTNGGLIGEGCIHGLNHTLEAVRQLRGDAANQIDDAHTALVTSSRTAVLLTR